jgi:hypothetical protein
LVHCHARLTRLLCVMSGCGLALVGFGVEVE